MATENNPYKNSFFRSKALWVALLSVIALGVTSYFVWLKPSEERYLRRADDHFRAGDYESAKIEYMNVLRMDQSNAPALMGIGSMWLNQGDPIRAFPYLQDAKKNAPDDAKIGLKLAEAQRALGMFDHCRNEVMEILRQSPGSVEAAVLLAETAQDEAGVDEVEKLIAELGLPEDGAAFQLAQGSLAVKRNDLQSAEAMMKKVLELDPDSLFAHVALGHVYFLQKDLEQAEPFYKAAAALAPRLSPSRLRHVTFKLQTDRLEEAKAELEEIIADVPDLLSAWEMQAQIAVKENAPDKALSLLEELLSRNPYFLGGRLLQARVQVNKGDEENLEKAIKNLEELRELVPLNSVVEDALAHAYLLHKDIIKATAALDNSLSVNPDNVPAVLHRANLSLADGDPTAAAIALEALLKDNPELEQAEFLLADAYRLLNRPDDVTEIFRKQIQRDPTAARPHRLLGMALRQQEKNAEAREALETAYSLAPEENAIALLGLIELDLLDEQYETGLKRLGPVLEKYPGSPMGNYMAGRLHSAQKDWENAEVFLLKALESNPNYLDAYNLLVKIYLATDRLGEALGKLDNRLAQNPNDLPALLQQGMLREQMGRYQEACDSYEKAIAVNPDLAAPLNNLAWLYTEKLDQPDKAYAAAEKARALSPEEGPIGDTLGWIVYKRGEFPRALALIQEAAGKLPDNPEVRFHLGMASYAMGQIESARAALEHAAAAESEFPGKEEAGAMIKLIDSLPSMNMQTLETRRKERPNDTMLALRFAELAREQGDHREAANACEEVVKLNPNLVQAHTLLAELYAGPLKDPAKAMQSARRARDLAPSDPKVAGILGGIAYRSGDANWAYSLLQESDRKLPPNATTLRNLALAAYELGKADEAEKTLQRIMDDPASDAAAVQDAKSFLAMLTFLQERGDPAKAFAEAAEILTSDPGNVSALMVQAAIQADRGEADAAVSIYNSVLKRLPDFASAQKGLASLYASMPDKSDAAHELASKARIILKDDIELTWTFAELNWEKDAAYARQLLQEIVRNKAPDSARGLYFFGRAQQTLGNTSAAKDTLNRSLKTGLQGSLAAEAKQALAEIEAGLPAN